MPTTNGRSDETSGHDTDIRTYGHMGIQDEEEAAPESRWQEEVRVAVVVVVVAAERSGLHLPIWKEQTPFVYIDMHGKL